VETICLSQRCQRLLKFSDGTQSGLVPGVWRVSVPGTVVGVWIISLLLYDDTNDNFDKKEDFSFSKT
jgi:hypothetical protein